MIQSKTESDMFSESDMSQDSMVRPSISLPLMVRTAEMVTDGHPDKYCDQIADAILDEMLGLQADPRLRMRVRAALEVTVKDNVVFLAGEVNGQLPAIAPIIQSVAAHIGYPNPENQIIYNHIQPQSAEIACGVDTGGAGDQGIMVGYATNETPDFTPLEYHLARQIAMKLRDARVSGMLPWLCPDGKTQVTLTADGKVQSVVVAAQHDESQSIETPDGWRMSPQARQQIEDLIINPIIAPYVEAPPRLVVNGTGIFTVGGPDADAGTVGRKIVADAYGPSVPVGGGAYSGKDATKVDRSAAYLARKIARTIVQNQIDGAQTCTVKIAYAIGGREPEMLTAITDTGRDLSEWVRSRFAHCLHPAGLIEELQLWNPTGWSYFETASFGHYGRAQFPWEQVETLD